jgi:chaperonin cofactor prefoldin
MKHSDKARSGAVVYTDKSSFKEMVDQSFDRLWEKKVEISIRRIRDLEEQLSALETELDVMLQTTGPGGL